jgi:hypothetical protein
MTPFELLIETLRLAIAVAIAFAGMTIVKSQRRTISAWVLRVAVALPLFLASLWIVFFSIPFPRDPGAPTFSIVGSAVLIAGLAVEELIGADLRRALRI